MRTTFGVRFGSITQIKEVNMDPAILLIGFVSAALVSLIVRWLNPPLKPPEDEWEKWKEMRK